MGSEVESLADSETEKPVNSDIKSDSYEEDGDSDGYSLASSYDA